MNPSAETPSPTESPIIQYGRELHAQLDVLLNNVPQGDNTFLYGSIPSRDDVRINWFNEAVTIECLGGSHEQVIGRGYEEPHIYPRAYTCSKGKRGEIYIDQFDMLRFSRERVLTRRMLITTDGRIAVLSDREPRFLNNILFFRLFFKPFILAPLYKGSKAAIHILNARRQWENDY